MNLVRLINKNKDMLFVQFGCTNNIFILWFKAEAEPY
jgi:hypothetical protein